MSTNVEANAAASDSQTSTRSRARRKASSKASASSKADLARSIFNKLHGKKPRKEVVDAFVSQAGLTPAGASTYYQRFSTGNGHGKTRGKASTKTSSKRASSGRSRGRPIDEDSKAGIARAIFKRMGGKKPRKEVIEAFQKEAKLTPAGSSTYYQKLKSAA